MNYIVFVSRKLDGCIKICSTKYPNQYLYKLRLKWGKDSIEIISKCNYKKNKLEKIKRLVISDNLNGWFFVGEKVKSEIHSILNNGVLGVNCKPLPRNNLDYSNLGYSYNSLIDKYLQNCKKMWTHNSFIYNDLHDSQKGYFEYPCKSFMDKELENTQKNSIFNSFNFNELANNKNDHLLSEYVKKKKEAKKKNIFKCTVYVNYIYITSTSNISTYNYKVSTISRLPLFEKNKKYDKVYPDKKYQETSYFSENKNIPIGNFYRNSHNLPNLTLDKLFYQSEYATLPACRSSKLDTNLLDYVDVFKAAEPEFMDSEIPLFPDIEKPYNNQDIIINNNNNIPNKELEEYFEFIWKKYPSPTGKKNAKRHFLATVKSNKDKENILIALQNYLSSDRVKKGYIKNGSTWFNEWEDWVNPTEIMIKGARNGAQNQAGARYRSGDKYTNKKSGAGGATTNDDIIRTIELAERYSRD